MNFNDIKRIICLLLCLIIALTLVSCNEEESCEGNKPTTNSSQPNKENSTDNKVIYKVSGKEYRADITTLNIAWEEGEAPTKIEQDQFVSLMKVKFENSKIVFLDESSFTMCDTNNQNDDFTASNCDRVENELFKEIKGRGNVDVLIYENKVSFLCDFFVKGWGMYISIDYKAS